MTDKLLLELASLSIYINITEDTAVKKLAELIRLLNGESVTPEETVKVYCGIYAHLLRNGCSNFYQHVENLTSGTKYFTLRARREN